MYTILKKKSIYWSKIIDEIQHKCRSIAIFTKIVFYSVLEQNSLKIDLLQNISSRQHLNNMTVRLPAIWMSAPFSKQPQLFLFVSVIWWMFPCKQSSVVLAFSRKNWLYCLFTLLPQLPMWSVWQKFTFKIVVLIFSPFFAISRPFQRPK